MTAWFRWANTDLLVVNVTVIPRARQPGIAGRHAGRLKIRVKAAPADGRANKEAQKILAELFGVAPGRVSLRRGASSREKVFEVFRPGVTPENLES